MAAKALLVDLGNHRLKWCVLDQDLKLGITHSCDASEDGMRNSGFREWLIQNQAPTFVASVNPRMEASMVASMSGGHPVFLTSQNCGLKISSSNTGADRIATALAAWDMCKGPAVVADFGTAWTLDFISGKGEFVGGAIGAGLGLQLAALERACPHLGEASHAYHGVPNDTPSALAVGSVRALAIAVQGLAKQFAKEGEEVLKGKFYTGGDAESLSEVMDNDWTLSTNLLMKGLAVFAQNAL